MNFIYNRLTRKTETKENNNNNNEKNFEQYLTYNDFRMSLILLTIMAHLNNKDMKITEEDYNNNLTVEKIEELFLDAYNFLTDEEQDVQLEIKNTTAGSSNQLFPFCCLIPQFFQLIDVEINVASDRHRSIIFAIQQIFNFF